MARKYRKTVEFEAMQWLSKEDHEGRREVLGWGNGDIRSLPSDEHAWILQGNDDLRVNVGDWILRDPYRYYEVCSPEVFPTDYEAAE